jgi:hypothetical protein
MTDKLKKDEILHDHNRDGIDRRGFLKCMAWAGTGAFCVIKGGVLKSYSLSRLSEMSSHEAKGELSFVQISDSHMGFDKAANPDVVGTLKAALDKINALPTSPAFMLHTGDITHLSKPQEFDTVDQLLKDAKVKTFSTCRANTMFSTMTASSISSATAKAARAPAGTALTTRAFILSGWSMS